MSGNVNCANYCNFGTNRTSNVRVNQGPGGNSSLSLAWDNEPPKQNVRSNNNGQQQYQQQYQQQDSYQMRGGNSDQQKYNPITNNPVAAYVPQYSGNNDYSGKDQGGVFPYANSNGGKYDPGDIKAYYMQQKRTPAQQFGGNDTYQPSNQFNNKPSYEQSQPSYGHEKTSVHVSQGPGGKSSFQIGGDYNYFKDSEGGNDKVGYSRNSHSPPKPESYNTLRNNYRNMVEQPNANQVQEYNPKYSAGNQYSNNNNGNYYAQNSNSNNNNNNQNDYYQKSNNQQQQNMPRQPNNLHDVKFGYRVNQPPGGRSSITFG